MIELRYYGRLWFAFFRTSFARGLQFRSDFAFRILMDCIYYAVNLGFFEVILHHTHELGGLSASQTRVFTASFLLMDGIYMTLFSSNVWYFPESVNRGTFDYTLVKPASSLFLTFCRDFSVGSFMNFLMACAILIRALTHLEPTPSLIDVALFLPLLLVGVATLLAVRLLFILPVFWFNQVDALRDISWTLNAIGERPSQIYPRSVRIFFTFVFPILTAIALPAEAFLSHWRLEHVLPVIGVSAVLWWVVFKLWERGTRSYASASS